MARHRTLRACALALALLAAAAAPARAEVTVCVDLQAPSLGERAGDHARWVRSEVRRHPGHAPVDAGCETTLHVEVLALEAGGALTLTGWLDGQVPVRLDVPEAASLREGLSRLIRHVLGTDPVAMARDVDRLLERVADSRTRLRAGPMLWGVEAFQTMIRSDEGAVDWLPGLAVVFERELGRLSVGARGAVAFRPRDPLPGAPARTTLQVLLEPQVTWFAAPDAPSSLYLTGSLGVLVQHHVGYTEDFGEESLSHVGAALGGRVGVEVLRAARLRVDLFLGVTLPLGRTGNDETPLVDTWTPSAHAGAGVAF